jgi:hypothetical protein
MKKMMAVAIALAAGLLLSGCLQQQTQVQGSLLNASQNRSAALDCLKTPGMAWCDSEQACINPNVENCTG